MLSPDLKAHLDELVGTNDVVLFMKGKRRLPQCGFSAQVVSVLDQIVDDYVTVNVLEDMNIREGIKQYSNWPTIPQLYVKGKFVGGCDIVTSMYQSGDLFQLFGKEPPKVEPPKITVTDGAKEALAGALAENAGSAVRFVIDNQWRPGLDLDQPKPDDFQIESNGITLLVDRATAPKADGVTIDFIPGDAGGFKIDNPNEPPRVRLMTPAELESRLKSNEKIELFDVRSEDERKVAKIEGSKLLDQSAAEYIDSLDRDETTLVFTCHFGQRSAAAAQHFLQQGFKKVYNLKGGIDAWSVEVDPNVPRY